MKVSAAVKKDICRRYREAKYPDRQIEILADLNTMSKMMVIGILSGNGEELPESTVKRLCRKMETLKKKIAAAEKEYKENARNVDYTKYSRLDKLNEEIAKYERQCKEIEEALGLDKKESREGSLW